MESARFACYRSILFIAIVMMISGCPASKILSHLSGAKTYLAEYDVSYGPHAQQKLDIYLPEKPSTTDSASPRLSCKLVFIYGGSWQSGEKSNYGFVGAAFAKLGYFVAIPNYRQFPEAVFPDFVDDVALAVSHPLIKKNKPDDKIVLIGHSAGALNAAHVAFDQQYLEKVGLSRSSIDLFISIAGPHDYFLPSEKEKWRAIFGKSDSEQLKALSVKHVNSDAPPTLVLHGNADSIVTPRSASSLASRLESKQIPHRLVTYDGVGHRRIIAALSQPLSFLAPTATDILKFLSEYHCQP